VDIHVLRFHGLFACGRVLCDVDIDMVGYDMVGYHIVYLKYMNSIIFCNHKINVIRESVTNIFSNTFFKTYWYIK